MKYKGPYSPDTTYNVGDVVINADGMVCHLQKPCKAGTDPKDTRYWGTVEQQTAQVIIMLADMFAELVSEVATIPKNIDDEGVVLKSGDNEYLITVDDSGDTPELAVTLIEEGEGD